MRSPDYTRCTLLFYDHADIFQNAWGLNLSHHHIGGWLEEVRCKINIAKDRYDNVKTESGGDALFSFESLTLILFVHEAKQLFPSIDQKLADYKIQLSSIERDAMAQISPEDSLEELLTKVIDTLSASMVAA